MKQFYYYIILILIFSTSISLYSKSDIQIENNIRTNVQTGSEGREFYVAFPYNDTKQQPGQNLAIYVTSKVDNKVTIFNAYLGLNITRTVKAYETFEFSTNKGTFGWDAEIFDFEKELDASIRITSEQPVSVFCMNSKSVSSEGYMAIPTKNWGREYIHNSFYDFNEVREWAGGFVVLAKEDQTQVTINIKDGANKASGFGETTGGKKHGDIIQVTLQAGEVYAVQGTGTTRGIFDLSGTHITSDKPVGLISHHNRCMIPATVVNTGRDHIIEMLPPISAWGTNYSTIEFDRGTDKGDYFRIIAGEDNTTFNVNWYDKETGEKISSIGPIELINKGDWYEYNGSGATAPHELESIRGVSNFTSDKPILVMQYSYSANYDRSSNYDPFMIVLPPVEQFVKSALFTRPQNYGNNEFRTNYINVIAIGDNTDEKKNEDLLNSITLNGEQISKLDTNIFKNNIPGTNHYWARFLETTGSNSDMRSNTPFGAFIYGFANFDSYGWPATANSSNANRTDTLSPEVTSIGDDCNFKFIVKDDPNSERNGNDDDKPRQIDTGVDTEPRLKTGSFNFNSPRFIDSDGFERDWPSGNIFPEFNFAVSLIDPSQDGMAVIEVTDTEGNTTEVSIFYEADKVSIELDSFRPIARTRVNQEIESEFIVRNTSDFPVTVNGISLKGNPSFRVADFSNPVTLKMDSTYKHRLYYKPKKEFTQHNFGKELDSIEVNLDCLVWKQEVIGQGYIPLVEISNMGFDSVDINEGISKQKGIIEIKNISDTPGEGYPVLVVKSIEMDPSSPDADIFSNFKVVETNQLISDATNINLAYGESINIEFDLNTSEATVGEKIARLIVTTDSGPASTDGTAPTTINNYDVEFDGNYTVDNSFALDDGGYIQVKFYESPQSSVEDGETNSPLRVNLQSSNPMNNELLRLSISNETPSITRLNITDIEGRVVMELMNEYVGSEVIIKEFNVSELNSGTYFISTSDGTHQTATKFIIAE